MSGTPCLICTDLYMWNSVGFWSQKCSKLKQTAHTRICNPRVKNPLQWKPYLRLDAGKTLKRDRETWRLYIFSLVPTYLIVCILKINFEKLNVMLILHTSTWFTLQGAFSNWIGTNSKGINSTIPFSQFLLMFDIYYTPFFMIL